MDALKKLRQVEAETKLRNQRRKIQKYQRVRVNGIWKRKLITPEIKREIDLFNELLEADTKRKQSSVLNSIRNLPISARPLLSHKLTLNERKEQRRPLPNINIPITQEGNIRVSVNVVGEVQISQDRRAFRFTRTYEGPASQLQEWITDQITDFNDDYFAGGVDWTLLEETLNITIRTLRTNQEYIYDYKQNRMRDQQPYIITNLFSNTIHLKQTEENCVKSFLRYQYPKISALKKDPISKLGNEHGVSTEDIVEFAKEFNIRLLAYNIHNQVIAKYTPTKDTKKYKQLIFLSYNNHIYPIKNKFLEEKPKSKKEQYLEHNELEALFKTLVKDHIVPADINYFNDTISSFTHDKVFYFYNDEYLQCKEILTHYGIEDKITPFTRFSNILNLIAKLYSDENIDSFLPINHQKSAFLYNSPTVQDKPLDTIDKNKAYSSIFKNLPYLLSTDYRTTTVETTNIKIEESALYIASAETPNILMPKQDIYSGQHIKYCQGKFVFKIHEKLKCKKHPNFYKHIINDLYEKVPENIAKRIVVKTIGTYQISPKVNQNHKVIITTEEERNRTLHSHKIHDSYIEFHPNDKVSNLYNRKPIAIQIKDKTNQLLYEKMIELNLKDEDIVQINTDSITFYAKDIQIKLDNTLDGWKRSKYTPSTANIFDRQHPIVSFFQPTINNNLLITGYAGNGKSYHIKHNLYTENAIIISTKHSAIAQHRKEGLNAQVIQAYEYSNTLPTENIIIVEECGLLDKQQWDILYKCSLLNKQIIALGDFQQLLPVEQQAPFNSPQFINHLFNTHETKNDNYRNHFTTDYYDSLLTGSKEYLKEQLLTHSTKTPEEADMVIAYRHIIVDKYNDYMLDHHKKTIYDNDVPIIAKSNELRDRNIYNNFTFTTGEIELTEDELKHFKPAYARTLYNLQGDEVKSFYVAPEDLHWFLTPRATYTLISRLKTK